MHNCDVDLVFMNYRLAEGNKKVIENINADFMAEK